MTRFLPWYIEHEGGRHVHIRPARGRLVVNVIVQMAGYKGHDWAEEYERRLPEAMELANKIVALANGGDNGTA
jgi:TolB-like protein